jgi:hypothetical protein
MYDPNAVRSISHQHVNRPPAGTCVGFFHVEQDQEVKISYEVAAWWANLLVPAGVYLAWITNEGFRGVRVTLEGTITSAYTPALFGGNPISSQQPQYENHRDVGTTARKVLLPYEYEVAEAMANPAKTMWEPAADIEPVVTGWWDRYGLDVSDGHVKRIGTPSWGLHMEAA